MQVVLIMLVIHFVIPNEWRDFPRNHTEEESVSLNLKPQSFDGETDYGSKMKECFRLKSQRFMRSFLVFRNLVSNSDKSRW